MSFKLNHKDADLFVPDGLATEEALARTTHLCVCAHQDDQEFMAYHGILECFGRSDRWFTGVVVTNGAGSPRSGLYAECSDDDMQGIRRQEQRKAAYVGEYSCQMQLAYPSSAVKVADSPEFLGDLVNILKATKPEFVYLHNPADKHDTHVASMLRMVAAIRTLPKEERPKKVYGCEVWRSLDWLHDADKCAMVVSEHSNLASSLSGVFDSQICGGKRYDHAVQGRRMANATFFESHATDIATALDWAVDLTPLIEDDTLEVASFIQSLINNLAGDISDRLSRMQA